MDTQSFVACKNTNQLHVCNSRSEKGCLISPTLFNFYIRDMRLHFMENWLNMNRAQHKALPTCPGQVQFGYGQVKHKF